MDRTAPHSARTEPPAPTQGRPGKAVPACIAAILSVVRVFLGYGKHLDQTLPEQTAHSGFPAIAIGFGTHDLRRILGHVQRGILRATMLQQYLLARAAQGRDIEPTERPAPAEQADIEAMEMKLRPSRETPRRVRKTDPDDPLHFSMPTLKELESQVRRRSIGRTIAEICMDLGVAASFCEGATWSEILEALMRFGANLEEFFGTQKRRREAFVRERDRHPDTWAVDWRDNPKDAVRQLLGALVGESVLASA